MPEDGATDKALLAVVTGQAVHAALGSSLQNRP